METPEQSRPLSRHKAILDLAAVLAPLVDGYGVETFRNASRIATILGDARKQEADELDWLESREKNEKKLDAEDASRLDVLRSLRQTPQSPDRNIYEVDNASTARYVGMLARSLGVAPETLTADRAVLDILHTDEGKSA